MSPEVCSDISAALQLLNRRRFEAVIIDVQVLEQAKGVLQQIHLSPSNKTAVTFSFSNTDEESSALFKAGSSFVLKRPVSTESINHTMKVAYGMIVRERRRYFRCPVAIPLLVRKQDMQEVQCQSLNLSEGGMAMITLVPLQPGTQAAVQFTLPGSDSIFVAKSVICWYDENSRAGLQFLALSGEQKSELQDWLSRRLEQCLPESVAEKFRGAEQP
jgi:hypothetical protein